MEQGKRQNMKAVIKTFLQLRKYLPSLAELDKLCLNKIAIGGFTDAGYWSSYEFSNGTHAFLVVFLSCNEVALGKYSGYKVRAIRSF